MPVKTLNCCLTTAILLVGPIAGISTSTSPREDKNALSDGDHQSTGTPPAGANPIFPSSSDKSLDDDKTPSAAPLQDALRDIAYYLRGHKFNEYDRRYETKAESAPRRYHHEFPRPPLRSLHWEVHKNCQDSLVECVRYLRRVIRRTGLRRTDDTAVVIDEQQWDLKNNSHQIEIVDNECKKMRDQDNLIANPFEGPLERFQWRTTATYFMCWYTLKSEPALKHLGDRCDNFANCLDPNLGPFNGDRRADDDNPFGCALHSFCPDPCCPDRHLTSLEDCWNTPDNPCHRDNPPGQRECLVNRSLNTEFSDLILNRWNVSCSCPQKGFRWNSLYGMCVDVDECALGSHRCDLVNGESCVNLPGNFKCACKWGHTFNKATEKCSPSDALAAFILRGDNGDEVLGNVANGTIWERVYNKVFGSSVSNDVKPSLTILSWFMLYLFE